MATQAALMTAIEGAITTAGLAPAPSRDVASWPTWAERVWVRAEIDATETGDPTGSGVDVSASKLVMFAVVAQPFDAPAAHRAALTLARSLRVAGETVGSGVAAWVVYRSSDVADLSGGVYLVGVTFDVRQADTF